MATVIVLLDQRRAKANGLFPLRFGVRWNRKAIYITPGIELKPDQWDATAQRVVNHPRRVQLNSYIRQHLASIQQLLMNESAVRNVDKLTTEQMRQLIECREEDKQDTFMEYFRRFSETKKGRTKAIYEATYSRLSSWRKDILNDKFEDINKRWLTEFDAFLAKTAPSANARAVHLRNIRAVINDAIDNDVTQNYPFRKYKIVTEPTRKRSLSAEKLREYMNYPVEEHQKKYMDFFKLSFLLIGMNVKDMCELKEVNDGRLEFNRAKTHRLYSIKVEPEAMEIIERYRGESRLLNVLDRYSNYHDFLKKLNEALQAVGPMEREGRGGRKLRSPLYPDITSYWARHSWATIAAELDIPKETIAAALGHGGNTVTDIYIDFDRKKVDEANRRVIDYVLYGKL